MARSEFEAIAREDSFFNSVVREPDKCKEVFTRCGPEASVAFKRYAAPLAKGLKQKYDGTALEQKQSLYEKWQYACREGSPVEERQKFVDALEQSPVVSRFIKSNRYHPCLAGWALHKNKVSLDQKKWQTLRDDKKLCRALIVMDNVGMALTPEGYERLAGPYFYLPAINRLVSFGIGSKKYLSAVLEQEDLAFALFYLKPAKIPFLNAHYFECLKAKPSLRQPFIKLHTTFSLMEEGAEPFYNILFSQYSDLEKELKILRHGLDLLVGDGSTSRARVKMAQSFIGDIDQLLTRPNELSARIVDGLLEKVKASMRRHRHFLMRLSSENAPPAAYVKLQPYFKYLKSVKPFRQTAKAVKIVPEEKTYKAELPFCKHHSLGFNLGFPPDAELSLQAFG